MKKKMTYVAPETEQMEIRLEKCFLESINEANVSVESANMLDEGEWN